MRGDQVDSSKEKSSRTEEWEMNKQMSPLLNAATDWRESTPMISMDADGVW